MLCSRHCEKIDKFQYFTLPYRFEQCVLHMSTPRGMHYMSHVTMNNKLFRHVTQPSKPSIILTMYRITNTFCKYRKYRYFRKYRCFRYHVDSIAHPYCKGQVTNHDLLWAGISCLGAIFSPVAFLLWFVPVPFLFIWAQLAGHPPKRDKIWPGFVWEISSRLLRQNLPLNSRQINA